ncbi:hypothetical protein MN608_07040 [Microdochium nivale]|nr:hypothetical protein MN608_07040 [Microdochium nivale]
MLFSNLDLSTGASASVDPVILSTSPVPAQVDLVAEPQATLFAVNSSLCHLNKLRPALLPRILSTRIDRVLTLPRSSFPELSDSCYAAAPNPAGKCASTPERKTHFSCPFRLASL